jgi:murein L,D-transpeptidase YcbB/YkuD
MKLFTAKAVSLPIAALAALLTSGVPEAGAATLFELLFNGNAPRRQRRTELPPPVRQTVAPARITGPSYYTYKADALKRVDFAPLAAIAQSASLDPATAGTAFREAIAGLDGFELFAEADTAKALIDHYSAHPDFIWVTGEEVNDRAREAVRVLGEAAGHGLLPADYSVAVPPTTPAGTDAALRKSVLIRFEMALSARALRYVRDAERGRVDPNRISGYYDFPAKPLDMSGALLSIATAANLRTFLESRHPQGAEYRALRVELEALSASEENDIVVDPKLLLKPGETNPELAKLLHLIARDLDDEMGGEYGEVLARLVNSETYVEELTPVIKAAQEKAGLKPDGVVGPRTVAALAGTSKAERVEKVLVALEQLRWLPSDLGSTRVFINEPAYTARYIEDGTEKLNMRVVVGKPANQTSFFYDEIEQVDYNPYWGVPQSILVNEMLPRLRRDPGYLDRAGYEVTDAKGRRISSSSVPWGAYGAKIPYNVRQTPSEANALGELKILFPNKHAIYMHDTPQKELFKRDVRAFSHGCVRLADPRGMAAAVLGTSVDYIAEKLKQGHSSEKVTRKIPVYVAYFTAWPDKNGKIEYFVDVYDRDARLKLAMEKTDAMRAPSS